MARDAGRGPDARASRARPLRYVPLLLLVCAVFAMARPFVVQSNDMAPAFQEGDLGLCFPKPTWLFGPIRRGDLVLAPPGDPSDRTLRRVVGMPGEIVEMAGGTILVEGMPLLGERTAQVVYNVNGKPRRFRRRTEMLDGGRVRYEVLEQEAWHLPDRPGVKLGPDEYYLLADRRTGAPDSRDWGPLAGWKLRRVFAVSFLPGYSYLFKGGR